MKTLIRSYNITTMQTKTGDNNTTTTAAPKSRTNLIVRSILSPLENMYKSLTNPSKIDPLRECSKFVSGYEQEYGNVHPPFSRQDFHAMVNRNHIDAKFTLVYLHCSVHQDTRKFCRQILNSNSLSDLLRADNITVWGGDVFHCEARWVSHMLKATTFPFLALLSPKSSSNSRKYFVLHSVMGCDKINSAPDLCRQLSTVMSAHKNEIDAIRREQMEKIRERELRLDQDAEYQRALEADRKKMREKKRQEEEKKQKEEEEKLQRALSMSRELEKKAEIERKRSSLSEEPKAGSGVSTFVFRIPDGSRLTRRFRDDEKLGMIFTFLDVSLEKANIKNYAFTAYPHRRFSTEETNMDMSLSDAKLTGRVAVFVQNLDA